MPFGEIHVVDERKRFIDDVHRSVRSFTAVCERYGISRNTGYTWLGRWRKHGPRGLADRSIVRRAAHGRRRPKWWRRFSKCVASMRTSGQRRFAGT